MSRCSGSGTCCAAVSTTPDTGLPCLRLAEFPCSVCWDCAVGLLFLAETEELVTAGGWPRMDCVEEGTSAEEDTGPGLLDRVSLPPPPPPGGPACSPECLPRRRHSSYKWGREGHYINIPCLPLDEEDKSVMSLVGISHLKVFKCYHLPH